MFFLFMITFPLTLPFLYRGAKTCDEKDLELITDIRTQIKEKENFFFDMEAYLPKRNGSELFPCRQFITDTDPYFSNVFL